MDRPPEESEEIAAYESIYEGTLNFISRRGGQHLNQPIDRHYVGPRRGGRRRPRDAERGRRGGWGEARSRCGVREEIRRGSFLEESTKVHLLIRDEGRETRVLHRGGDGGGFLKAAVSRFGRFDSRWSPASSAGGRSCSQRLVLDPAGEGGREESVRGAHVDTPLTEGTRLNRRESVKSAIGECAGALCRYPRCRRCDYVTPPEGGEGR